MKQFLQQWWTQRKPREKRLSVYLLLVLAFAAWKLTPRYWKPTTTVETRHYIISSTATQEQTEEIGRVVEVLYSAYSNRLHTLPSFNREHGKLKLLLYKDRTEFRRINPGMGWAEAFYKKPFCRAYYSADESNPYQWMLHEAVHQLNEEVAGLKLEKWLEEGLAEYFSTSPLRNSTLLLGGIDPDTYPIWWIDQIAVAPDLQQNLKNNSVIPLRAIVTGSGGPMMNSHVNLYYLHWWSLTHFIFENKSHEESAARLLVTGGDLKNVEEILGPIDATQEQWHRHVKTIKTALRNAGITDFPRKSLRKHVTQ